MSHDYTLNQPKASSLQEALDEAFGEQRMALGQVFEAASVDEVRLLVQTAHLYDSQVRVGTTASKNELTLSLDGLAAIREVDSVSGLVTVETGCTLAALNERLSEDGLRLPPGYFANPDGSLSDALSAGEGGPLIVSMGGVLPDGMHFHTPLAPRRATGSNPDALLSTTRHQIAVVVWVTLRVDFLTLSPEPLAYQGRGKDIVGTTRELLITGVHAHSVHLLKGTRGQVTVTWASYSDTDRHRVAQAFDSPAFKTVSAQDPIPPVGRPQRVLWTGIFDAMKGTAKPGQWVGLLDTHGGWVRTLDTEPAHTDDRLQQVHHALDAQQTLLGESP